MSKREAGLSIRAIQSAVLPALLVAVSVAFTWLIWDFAIAIFWAAVLAVLFHGLYQRVLRWFGNRQALASVATVAIILILVILPLSLVATAVGGEAAGFYTRIDNGEIDVRAPVAAVQRTVPQLTGFLSRIGLSPDKLSQSVSGAAVTASRYLASKAFSIGQDALRIAVLFFIMVYLLFFFLRDGDRLIETIIRALPLGDVRERRLFSRFAQVTRATIKGTLIVGAAQGTLGGLIFWILGIDAAVFWGVMMTLASLVPAAGSGLIWVPASIILLATGHAVKALILTIAGIFLIGLVDNLLRPLLVGRDTRMPDYMVLLSTLGGLAVFGLEGFVVGPVIAAIFLTVWQMFIEEYGSADDPPGGPETTPRADSESSSS